MHFLMGFNGSTGKEKDYTTHSWPLTFLTEVSCLEDVHVYSTLFNVDRNISACLFVGVTHKHSQTAGDKDWSSRSSLTVAQQGIKLAFQRVKLNRYQGLTAWLTPATPY